MLPLSLPRGGGRASGVRGPARCCLVCPVRASWQNSQLGGVRTEDRELIAWRRTRAFPRNPSSYSIAAPSFLGPRPRVLPFRCSSSSPMPRAVRRRPSTSREEEFTVPDWYDERDRRRAYNRSICEWALAPWRRACLCRCHRDR